MSGPGDPLDAWAIELGVRPDIMRRLVEERRALAFDIASAPRAWGFDLVPAAVERRDAGLEFRRRTRLTGSLPESFLVGDPTLQVVVPTTLTFEDGRALRAALMDECALPEDVATVIEAQLRAHIVSRLGRALDRETIDTALREAAWEFGYDPATLVSVTQPLFGQLV